MKRRLIQNQRLQDQVTRRKSASPYHDWLGRSNGQGEPRQANPDSLAESAGFYSVTEEQAERAEAVRELFKHASQYLTELQFKVFLQMTEGKSLRFIGRALGLNTSTVRESWLAAQKKLQKKFQAIYG